MKVYLYRTYGENGRVYDDIEVWGKYRGYSNFWDYDSENIVKIPLNLFEAKSIEQKNLQKDIIYWVEKEKQMKKAFTVKGLVISAIKALCI